MAINTEIPDKEKRQQALERAISHIDKQFGKGTIMKLGGETKLDVPVISTGALSLDIALGVGGIPRGRVVEIFGQESSGKTTLTLQIIANAQKGGGVAAFIDAEHALDSEYAKKLGVNLNDLMVNQPDTGEQALEIAELLVRSNAVDVIVIDSVAALVPRAEIEGEMGDTHIGLQARLMSQALRKLTACISKSRTSVIFINQLREKIGVMYGGNPETTPGGRALKFYASVRIDIRRIGSIKDGDAIIGSRVRATIAKNKVAAPFKRAEFDILYNTGISLAGDVLDLGAEHNIIEKAGTWYSYRETRLGQGRENSRQFLTEHPEMMKEIEQSILKIVLPSAAPQKPPEKPVSSATVTPSLVAPSAAPQKPPEKPPESTEKSTPSKRAKSN
ncbi:MAG: recombinase RecA [Candidatus Kuenenia sp.]|nr:recombinase RecA [Candidatus Kuenenia sp.]